MCNMTHSRAAAPMCFCLRHPCVTCKTQCRKLKLQWHHRGDAGSVNTHLLFYAVVFWKMRFPPKICAVNLNNVLPSAVTHTMIHTMTMKWRPFGEVASMKTSECSTQKLLFLTTTVWVPPMCCSEWEVIKNSVWAFSHEHMSWMSQWQDSVSFSVVYLSQALLFHLFRSKSNSNDVFGYRLHSLLWRDPKQQLYCHNNTFDASCCPVPELMMSRDYKNAALHSAVPPADVFPHIHCSFTMTHSRLACTSSFPEMITAAPNVTLKSVRWSYKCLPWGLGIIRRHGLGAV